MFIHVAACISISLIRYWQILFHCRYNHIFFLNTFTSRWIYALFWAITNAISVIFHVKNLCMVICFLFSCVVSVHSVQPLSYIRLFVTPWIATLQASLSITNSQSLFKLILIELVMPSSQLILCCPLLLLPSILPSIRVFCNESALHIKWPKYRSFSFSISPTSEFSGLISFRMDWLDLLEWFALEMNRDHTAIFETASKYCILYPFFDYDGHFISSKGFLPTVVDIMVI